MNLVNKKCVPCKVGAKSLSGREVKELLREISGWELDGEVKKITREFKFKDFVEALAFVNKVGEIAESEGHHPDIRLSYGKVNVELWTHSVGGLSENDFILAAKVSNLV